MTNGGECERAEKLMLLGIGVASFEINFYTCQAEMSLNCALKSGTFHEIKIASILRSITHFGYLKFIYSETALIFSLLCALLVILCSIT